MYDPLWPGYYIYLGLFTLLGLYIILDTLFGFYVTGGETYDGKLL